MKKTYLKLTNDQKARGVIFSSQLMPNGTIHEVLENEGRASEKIERLYNDKFFDNSPYTHNEIRQ